MRSPHYTSLAIICSLVAFYVANENFTFIRNVVRVSFLKSTSFSSEGGDDCCGIECKDKPRFVPFTDADMTFFHAVWNCVKPFPTHGGFLMPAPNASLRVLQCHQRGTWQALLSTLQQYERIIFIGDSILNQHYFTFLCMLDPSLSSDQVITRDTQGFGFQEYECVLNKTRITYQLHGWIWNRSEPNCTLMLFPKPLRLQRKAMSLSSTQVLTMIVSTDLTWWREPSSSLPTNR